MGVKHRYPNRGWRNLNTLISKNLAGFVNHLHLLLAVPIVQKNIDVRETVEGNLVRVHFFLYRLSIKNSTALLFKLFDGFLSGPGNGLVSRNYHTSNTIPVLNGLESNDHLDRRTIGISNNLQLVPKCVRVDLRHNERNALFHPPSTAVVDDNATRFYSDGSVLSAHSTTRREQSNIDPSEGIFAQLPDFDGPPLVPESLSRRPSGGQHSQTSHWKIALLQGR